MYKASEYKIWEREGKNKKKFIIEFLYYKGSKEEN